MEIHILDVGTTKYGDCILITHQGKTIMIDGAHPGDQDLLSGQIAEILQNEPPFIIDLLIVTHCHLDHIGCLPKLINDGIIDPKTALVADEKLGFGRTDDGIGPADSPEFDQTQKTMIKAVQEEDHSDLPDEELFQFISDAAKLEDRYIEMLDKMKTDGCRIIRYGDHTSQQISSLETAFKNFGLEILGPSQEHLVTCGMAIAGTTDALPTDSIKLLSDNLPPENLATVYRAIMKSFHTDAGLSDEGSQASAARNNQSIIVKVKADGWSALLPGDMQYARAEVNDLDEMIEIALQEAVDAGPYDFIKLPHHTAANGLNQLVFDAFSPCKLYAHTGGKKDARHPNRDAIKVLKASASNIRFSRTDRNGHIIVKKDGIVKMINARGTSNNFSLNTTSDEKEEPTTLNKEPENLNVRSRGTNDGYVEITARIPHESTRVTITVDIDHEKKNSTRIDRTLLTPKLLNSSLLLGGGRSLPKLLFVTSKTILERNIGRSETSTVMTIINSSKESEILDLQDITNIQQASKKVHEKLLSSSFAGVVIVGGYDVVPSQALDVLNPQLRTNIIALKKSSKKDQDNFIVWSDDIYVDLDNDTLPELPVTRIPDARRADLVLTALCAPSFSPGKFFAIRNIERPFAEDVFKKIPNSSGIMNVSETINPDLIKKNAALGAVYYMLHGSDEDGTLYWGETPDEDTGDSELFDALSIRNIPTSSAGSIVLAGCCWGALTVYPKAMSFKTAQDIVPKSPEDSIALTYLLYGAQAFVGCTGSHYSPFLEPYNYYGKPLHDAFWQEISKSVPPAKALWEAKKKYALAIPHDQTDLFSRGIEIKTLRQFTCLGLGW